jgi:hypothetical protein
MRDNYPLVRSAIKQDFFDVLADLPRLPKGAVPLQPYSVLNPVAVDHNTGVYYKLSNGQWEMADK